MSIYMCKHVFLKECSFRKLSMLKTNSPDDTKVVGCDTWVHYEMCHSFGDRLAASIDNYLLMCIVYMSVYIISRPCIF